MTAEELLTTFGSLSTKFARALSFRKNSFVCFGENILYDGVKIFCMLGENLLTESSYGRFVLHTGATIKPQSIKVKTEMGTRLRTVEIFFKRATVSVEESVYCTYSCRG